VAHPAACGRDGYGTDASMCSMVSPRSASTVNPSTPSAAQCGHIALIYRGRSISLCRKGADRNGRGAVDQAFVHDILGLSQSASAEREDGERKRRESLYRELALYTHFL